MGLLSGYGSDESASSAGEPGAKRRRVVRLDYAKLPVSRPLPLPSREAAAQQLLEEPEEAEGAESEDEDSESSSNDSANEGRQEQSPALDEEAISMAEMPSSLVDLLPRPKKEMAAPLLSDSQVDIDFATAGKPKEKPQAMGDTNAWVVRAAQVPEVEETQDELPERLQKHPLLRTLQASPAGPTQAEVAHLTSSSAKLLHISADSMKDPNWRLNNLVSGQPGLLRASRVPADISQYDQARWQGSTLSNPSKTQKRKHHINWLAQEAIEKEAEDLDRAAGGKLTKAQTRSRYGW
ncbi:unnamed protein product [Symbiodinium pilosum]|uniref:Proline-rich protein PRCC n=1 Tax=Symbiodinium pilosum TaxID=2952 RepID=A0A812WYK8_SYMPI|nr:unnamed protein product [Symbiodinium pilosum]